MSGYSSKSSAVRAARNWTAGSRQGFTVSQRPDGRWDWEPTEAPPTGLTTSDLVAAVLGGAR